ncbi:miraculin-like [Gastrolobium bilobum]|uniref:miraculin-like n=1 Tax=Gastrolobium bilobum TaxID=150636 RepID=UPI002AB1B13B|nr:miraculin-like [Gastrolobium bilobum]
MKSIIFLPFLFAFALCTQFMLGAADASPEQVIDTQGKEVRTGMDYYIRPVPTTPCDGRGPCVVGSGFVLIARSSNETCPLSVAVVEGFRGQAVTFTPVNSRKGVVRVSTDLNIKVSLETICTESTVWKLDDFDASTGQWFVTTGGVVGNPGKNTISNWFKIEKYEDDYKLVFCPRVCETCKPLCKNVGVFVDSNGNQRVALTDEPYKVRFQPST